VGLVAVDRIRDGHHVSWWVWVGVAVLLAVGVLLVGWPWFARLVRPPMRYDIATLPPRFSRRDVAERVRGQEWVSDLQAEADASDDPELKDRAYLLVEDLVDMEYVEVVRGCMAGRELRVRRLPVVHEPGTDSSGRPFVETMRESWRLEEPIVVPGRQERHPWILVDQIDACARYTDDGVYRWTGLHGRAIDPVTGEVARTREETYAGAGIADLLRETPPV
jgi:hypothetical protein